MAIHNQTGGFCSQNENLIISNKAFHLVDKSRYNIYLHCVMKHCLITLIFCTILLNISYAQSPSAAIDSLIKFKVITNKDRPVLEGVLREKSHSSNQDARSVSDRLAILIGLESVMEQKTFHIKSRKTGGIWISYSGSYPIKMKRDSANKSLGALLTKINNAGLLSNKVYKYAQKDIDSSRYIIDMQLIAALAEMTARLESLTPARLLPLAEQLHKSGIVNDTSFSRLQNDIRNEKIESISQLNDYWQLSRTIDIEKYPADPHLWLEQIYRDIASIIPGLSFTNFSYTETQDTSLSIGKIQATKFKIRFNCNGKVYKHTFASIFYSSERDKLHLSGLTAGGFFRALNKVLADQQSPLRLHSVIFNPPYVAENSTRYLTTIALTAEQAEMFMHEPYFRYVLVSMDSYTYTLTSAKIDSAIAGWKTIGLFAHLSKAEIDTAADNAMADDWISMNRLLTNFPKVIYPTDSAMMSPTYPYVSLLKHLAGITHGAFSPTNITQKKVKGGVKLQYSFKGKTHSHIFNITEGWLGTPFVIFLKNLGLGNNLPGKFYQLDFDDVIYLTQQQYNAAVKHKLLDFTPEASPKDQ
ncbi:hypothetical protein [Mucilaginibacter endophyticus]|uniref:hypothetical protein n=1 Tax=Mucilaginibacter endophyticus TaxID=2675003 RepID=UPI0012B17B40|nr:hypothetical protein [Mucilaginibacter endophyticus]